MKLKIELTEEDVKELIVQWLSSKLEGMTFNPKNVVIEVKSKQNYKSEWERASFRAYYENDKGSYKEPILT